MKRIFLIFLISVIIQPVQAFSFYSQENAVKNVIKSQIKYANKGNFDKFIATYDSSYVNSDGFNLDVYSELIKDVWSTYNNIKYDVKIKNVEVNNNTAQVEVVEYANAGLAVTKNYTGALNSVSNNIYNLEKIDGKWKVVSDSIIDETTTMLYGAAQNLDIKLTVPQEIAPDTEYTASLEFDAPNDTIAIASISSDKIEYPQKQSKEVFRTMPEDNILERLFTSNSDNADEYVVAAIGLTKTNVEDLSIKLSLTGFGYVIKRVNVLSSKDEVSVNE
jgi:hypothetical protein